MYFGVQSFSFGYPRPKLKLWTPISPIIHGSVLSSNSTTQEIPAAELDNAEPLPEAEPISLPAE